MATAPYVINPDDPTNPTENLTMGAAAAELRALKQRVLLARQETADLEARTLSHVGAEPYELDAQFNANENKITELPQATEASDAVPLSQVLTLIGAAGSGIIASVRQKWIAAEGQTAFTLTQFSYVPTANNIAVYVNGIRQDAGTAYIETNSTSFTFVEGLPAGSVVLAFSNESVDADAVDLLRTDLASTASGKGAEMVAFKQSGTGAVDRTLQEKNEEIVSVKDFGAVGDGVADDTAAIQAAIDYAIGGLTAGSNFPLSRPVKIVIPAGDYKITSGLSANRRVWVTGDGMWATRLICTTSGTSFYGFSLRPDASGGAPIWGAIIENLQIVGNGGATRCSGISTGSTAPYTVSQSVYQNLVMYDVATGMKIGDGADNSYYNNRFFNIKVTGTGETGVTAYGLKIESAVYSTFEGIEVTGTGSSAYSYYIEGGWNSFTQLACDGVSYMDIPNSTLKDFTVEGLIASTVVSGTALNIGRASLLQNINLIDCPNSKTSYGLTTSSSGIVIEGYNVISTGAGQPNYIFAPASGSSGVLHGFTSTNPPTFLIDIFVNADTMSRWHFAACPTLTYKGGYYNDAGSVTFAASTTAAVAFTKAQPDTSYVVALAPQANKIFWVTSKTVNGFTLNASASSSDTVDWSATR